MNRTARSALRARALALAALLAAAAPFAVAQTAAQSAAQRAAATAASNRAVERCTALARQQNVRVGKLESVRPVAPGIYEVHWARPFFGKPQQCRYEALRDMPTLAGSAGLAGLPAPVPVNDKATREEAMGACQRLMLSMGKGSPIPKAVTPVAGGFLDVELEVGGDVTNPPEKCRYDVNRKTAEPLR